MTIEDRLGAIHSVRAYLGVRVVTISYEKPYTEKGGVKKKLVYFMMASFILTIFVNF